jgi:ATP-dependent HslUV protease subunit HslV
MSAAPRSALPPIHATTILSVRRHGHVALGGDGQVSLGEVIVKAGASKVRKLAGGTVLGGFAGGAADGLTLFELLEAKLETVGGNLTRACVELAKDWRLDRRYRRLEAHMIVCDVQRTLLLSGNGDVIEPDDGACAIGSGGGYALAAARSLLRHTDRDARTIVDESLRVAGEICVHTNLERTIVELGGGET